MNYDYTKQIDNINYGFLVGNHRIVFIKTGLEGDIIGYENKYLSLAQILRDEYGCSVIVSSNPKTPMSHSDIDKAVINQYALDNPLSPVEFLFLGNSNGAIKGLELTNSGIVFAKMVLVNMPLMINFHKTKHYIASIPQTKIIAVYGEYDPSFKYIPFLKDKFNNTGILTIPNADHNFSGMLSNFLDLAKTIVHD